jgi:RNA polymerase sigma-70 factor (ECF subfamily)
VDQLRRAATGAAKLQEVAVLSPADEPSGDDSGVEDDRLRLIFTCCHPALSVEAQVALTLRTLAGLTTAEIARAFLVPEATLAQRLVRAKRKQAAIAACHASAPDATETDWVEIAALYGELVRMVPSPVVELNRAVAVAMADGPEAGLRVVEALDASGSLDGYHLLPATRADLLRRLGRSADAADAYRDALGFATSDAERRYLSRRLAETSARP